MSKAPVVLATLGKASCVSRAYSPPISVCINGERTTIREILAAVSTQCFNDAESSSTSV